MNKICLAQMRSWSRVYHPAPHIWLLEYRRLVPATTTVDLETALIMGLSPSPLRPSAHSRRTLTHTFELPRENVEQEPVVGESKAANLDALPLELLLQIAMYLPKSSQVSLHYVTRSGARRSDNGVARATRAERLQLLCMLERHLLIRKPRVVCGGCFSTHDISFFTEELAKGGFGRECVGRVGRLLICPETLISFAQLEAYDFWRGYYTVEKCSTYVHLYVLSAIGVKITWSLIQTSYGLAVSITPLTKLLEQLDVPICLHTRSGNPLVLRSLSPICGKNKWKTPFERRSCGHCFGATPRCSICGMKVVFDISLPHGNRRRILVMEIKRETARYERSIGPRSIA